MGATCWEYGFEQAKSASVKAAESRMRIILRLIFQSYIRMSTNDFAVNARPTVL